MALNRCAQIRPHTEIMTFDRRALRRNDDEQSRFVETVAALAHRDGMGRVTASHVHGYALSYNRRVCVTPVPPVEMRRG